MVYSEKNSIIYTKNYRRILLRMKIYRFRNCYLDPVERRVLMDGKRLDLTTKTFDVLQLLVENRGAIVTKDEILGKVWNGSFVEEGNLAVHISKLRKLLGESRSQPFIETVQGSGYRFVAPVHEAVRSDLGKHSSKINRFRENRFEPEWIFDSIAVLPLENESGDAEIEYLADGLTESFINRLSRLANLKVIARNTVFRYKSKDTDAKEVGEILGVTTVLTGRIRIIKDNLSLNIELTKTADGTQLWGKRFNRRFTDIFEIQESIIVEVLEKLKAEISIISKNVVSNLITKNSESYRFYLKGKYFLDKCTQESLHKAIEYFKQSVLFDPANVHSYVQTIESYFLLYFSDYISYTKVLAQIKPILSIISKMDQNIDVVQAMYGGKKMCLDWEFEEAEKHFKNALQINPNCLTARYRFSDVLLLTKKVAESLEELKQISLIDPLSVNSRIRIGRIFYKMGRYENAVIYLKEALELEPTNYLALAVLAAVLIELENYQEALTLLDKSLNIQFNFETLSYIGYLTAVEGNKDESYRIIERIKALSEDNHHSEMKLAKIYLGLGEKELTYKFLDAAFEKHDVDLISLGNNPIWTPLNSEPRFKELMLKIGLPVD